MTNKTMIAKAVKYALYSGFAASMAVAAPATFAAEEEADDAETVVVTGSRLKRTDVEGANPVTVITREQIELSGEISAAELLRNTTFNTTGSFRPQSGSSAQGVAMIDLRGIGSSRSLVLVDGRRLTMSPSTGSSQDLNSIPMGAIERVEILTDGASAIYGSDAIGGVVNVITRKDYNGAEISLQKAEPSVPAEGGEREAGSLVFGSSNDTTSLLGGVSWNKREIVFQRDFPWTQPALSRYGNNWRRSDFSNPYQAIPGGCEGENYVEIGDFCGYNFNATNANEASTTNESLYLKASHMINDDWQLYSNATVAKNQSFGRYAPIPDTNYFQGYAISSDSYNNPTNPDAWMYDTVNNPNAVAYDAARVGAQTDVHMFHRFAALGNRDNTVDNENVDFLVGATGFVGDVELDFNMRRVRNKSYDYGNGYLAAQIAWNFVNEFNPGYDSGGVFVGESEYYGYDIQNPFDNPANVLSGSAITILRVSDFNFDEVAASAAFDLGELDGGAIQMFVGADRREEYYSDQYDAQSEAGQVGGSAGNSAGGGRDVNAMYFETLLPFTEDFELSVAGRFDDYSDYGNDFSPKVSMRYQPMEELTLRASYGEGFRAPTLDILTQLTSFSADAVRDPATCLAQNLPANCETQINAYRIANPDLESEQSKQYAFGLAYQPTDWVNFTLDYYDIQIDNRIAFFSSGNLLAREDAGDPIPPGLGVTRRQDGSIAEILTGYGNEGDLETNGVDMNTRFNFDFEDAGRLASNFQVSWIHDYSVDGGRNLTRDPGVPQWRAALQNVYNINDFTIAWNVNAIGSQYIDVESISGGRVGRTGNWGTWTTHDLQVSYNTSWDGQISVGAQNVFEKLPRLEPFDNRDYNYYLYNGYGRVAYVRYTQTF
ncbi:TonB-dependent receptor plug domain-containing protein [Kangiella koreensis]|uniref:TonB-dependent receptor n=1 Tax=Kangiella koreensis (strain DSM 16069 / JCM 12317 / KCTC 12182 / SW-125) TaxID=523791 RepID=C7R8D1_KANKD|nr:TonB-dependent receptor [Kangiella koreensis]ACV27696.1 TonB-dependent receptor [Kangiella koreensis DSM 16069]